MRSALDLAVATEDGDRHMPLSASMVEAEQTELSRETEDSINETQLYNKLCLCELCLISGDVIPEPAGGIGGVAFGCAADFALAVLVLGFDLALPSRLAELAEWSCCDRRNFAGRMFPL